MNSCRQYRGSVDEFWLRVANLKLLTIDLLAVMALGLRIEGVSAASPNYGSFFGFFQ